MVEDREVMIRRLRSICGTTITRRAILLTRMAVLRDPARCEARITAGKAARYAKTYAATSATRYSARHAARHAARDQARCSAIHAASAAEAEGLDDVLDVREAAAYAQGLDIDFRGEMTFRSLLLQRCDCCKKYKFKPISRTPESQKLNEFTDLPDGIMSCDCLVCSSCLQNLVAISTDDYAWEDYALRSAPCLPAKSSWQ
jgi:hypothetical protein